MRSLNNVQKEGADPEETQEKHQKSHQHRAQSFPPPHQKSNVSSNCLVKPANLPETSRCSSTLRPLGLVRQHSPPVPADVNVTGGSKGRIQVDFDAVYSIHTSSRSTAYLNFEDIQLIKTIRCLRILVVSPSVPALVSIVSSKRLLILSNTSNRPTRRGSWFSQPVVKCHHSQLRYFIDSPLVIRKC